MYKFRKCPNQLVLISAKKKNMPTLIRIIGKTRGAKNIFKKKLLAGIRVLDRLIAAKVPRIVAKNAAGTEMINELIKACFHSLLLKTDKYQRKENASLCKCNIAWV